MYFKVKSIDADFPFLLDEYGTVKFTLYWNFEARQILDMEP